MAKWKLLRLHRKQFKTTTNEKNVRKKKYRTTCKLSNIYSTSATQNSMTQVVVATNAIMSIDILLLLNKANEPSESVCLILK